MELVVRGVVTKNQVGLASGKMVLSSMQTCEERALEPCGLRAGKERKKVSRIRRVGNEYKQANQKMFPGVISG
jgi:hypothetical protein